FSRMSSRARGSTARVGRLFVSGTVLAAIRRGSRRRTVSRFTIVRLSRCSHCCENHQVIDSKTLTYELATLIGGKIDTAQANLRISFASPFALAGRSGLQAISARLHRVVMAVSDRLRTTDICLSFCVRWSWSSHFTCLLSI